MSSVRALLTSSPKCNKRKVFSGSKVTLPVNFACKPELSFNPLARVTLAVGLPYLLVNRALQMKTVLACALCVSILNRPFNRLKGDPSEIQKQIEDASIFGHL